MKTFVSKALIFALLLSGSISSVSAATEYYYRESYTPYRNTYIAPAPRRAPVKKARAVYKLVPVHNQVECPGLSSASVGIGTISDGVNISVISYDSTLQRCIKNTSWLSYFTQFGNTVSVKVSNTTFGVLIVATSYDSSVVSRIQNTQWSTVITGGNQSYDNPNYSYSNYSDSNYYNTYNPSYYSNYQPYNPYPSYTYPQYTNTTYSDRIYRNGTDVFGGWTRNMSRSASNISNGVRMTFVSPDYNAATYLQNYYFTQIFSSEFIGISISQVNIPGGIEVTVTSGSSSTVREIQNMGYALAYR